MVRTCIICHDVPSKDKSYNSIIKNNKRLILIIVIVLDSY